MLESILIYGSDATLLLTRTLVLEHAGFRIKVLSDPLQLSEGPENRLLLCSSLSEPEQLEAIRLMRTRRPGAKILVVGEERFPEDKDLLRMSGFLGAEGLIENVRLLAQ